MSLIKSSLVAGGSSLQTYLRDGNNIHTEQIGEWIFVEGEGFSSEDIGYWRLSGKGLNVQLFSLWGNVNGTLTLTLQYRDNPVFQISLAASDIAKGISFPTLIIPKRFDLVFSTTGFISKIFLTAKEIAICEDLTLLRQ